MSFKKTGSHYDKNLKEWLEHFEADCNTDMQALPQCNPGSTCYIKETGKTVTVADNGVWDGASGGSGGAGGSGGGVMYVNFELGEKIDAACTSCTADKTYAEILEAYMNGQMICGRLIIPRTYDEKAIPTFIYQMAFVCYGSDDPIENMVAFGPNVEGSGYDFIETRIALHGDDTADYVTYIYDLKATNPID